MREDTARAVLRDARQRGHDHVELRRDGPHTIFYCNLCGTRCYSDAALADHLNGNRHGRRSAMTRASSLVVREQQLPQSWPTVVPASRSLLKRPGEETESESTAVAMVLQNGGCDVGGKSREEIVPGLTGSATTSLRWMGSGQLFLKMLGNGGAPPVEAAWFCWYGMHRPVEVIWQDGSAGRMEYAVVVFPYSDRIGRGGDWTSLNTSDENVDVSVAGNKGAVDSRSAQSGNSEVTASEVTAPREIVVHTQTAPSAQLDTAPCSLTLTIRTKSGEALAGDARQEDGEQVKLLISKEEPITTYRRGWKRKQAKIADRICFICHQKLLPGKDVAALVNVKSGQMVCGSRNRRGVFHVFHTSCLIDWIAFCEAKAWKASHSENRNKKVRRSRQTVVDQSLDQSGRQDVAGTKTGIGEDGVIFCPECQGTGVKVHSAQLERPRFRLAQVFNWLLELIQARKSWIDHPIQQVKGASGLLFVTPEKTKSQGVVQSQGLIHCYSAGSLGDLAATVHNREVT